MSSQTVSEYHIGKRLRTLGRGVEYTLYVEGMWTLVARIATVADSTIQRCPPWHVISHTFCSVTLALPSHEVYVLFHWTDRTLWLWWPAEHEESDALWFLRLGPKNATLLPCSLGVHVLGAQLPGCGEAKGLAEFPADSQHPPSGMGMSL